MKDFLKKVGAISDFLHMYYYDNRRNAWKMVSTKKAEYPGKKLDRCKKNRKFFKNSETKTACPGEKLGRDKNFGLFSKSVRVNNTHRERNWMGTQWR